MQQVLSLIRTGILTAFGINLLYLSCCDAGTRELPARGLFAAGVLAVSGAAVTGTDFYPSYLIGLLIGSGFLLVSFFTRESLGYGDSYLILFLGLLLGRDAIIMALGIAWALAALAAGVLLVRNRFRRGITMPMVPFLSAGYWIWFLFGR